MQGTLIEQGLELMTYGMGTVFVFLMLLVVVTTAMSALVQRFSKPEPAMAPKTGGGQQPQAPEGDQNLLAVITAAIHKHRSRHK